MAEGRTGRIPPVLLVSNALEVTRGADWPVQRAALEATLRRLRFAQRDDLRLHSRPQGPFGLYRTRTGGAERPYSTLVESIEPLRGSCDCPDFLRNSLGLCKHLLIALDAAFERPKRLDGKGARAGARGPLRLTWDPVWPLGGRADWLERLRLLGDAPAQVRQSPALRRLLRRFRPAADGIRLVRDAHSDHAARRLRLVRDLRAAAGRGASLEPAAAKLLAEEGSRLERVLELRRSRHRSRTALRQLRRPLYAYQSEGVERMLETGRLVLADDMGLGKTAQAIAVCHTLLHAHRIERGLLVVPASLKGQWVREWQLFSDAPIELVEGRPEERARIYRQTRRGFLVTNYEQVLRDLEAILAWSPGLVVLDEAQRIKNWATKTAVYVKKLRPPYRMVLTGTPMENRLEELASIVEWIDDCALEPKWRLAPWHSAAIDDSTGARGARNLDTLRQRLAPVFLRRRRDEVLRQLPPRTDTVVPVALTEAQAGAHDDLMQPIARLAAIARRRPLTQAEFLRLMQLLTTQRIIANGLAQLRFTEVWEDLSKIREPDEAVLQGLDAPKLVELREMLVQLALDQGRKVVVFSQWRRMLQLADWVVGARLARSGVRTAFFSGRESPRRRTQNLVEFHDDPALRVLFATDAGGVGLNLQRAASCVINLDLPWNPAVLEQRIGRIYRLGQTRPIDVYNLVSQGSIEARIATLVGEKRALFRGLFDGSSDQVRFERSGSFLEVLERIVEPPRAPELSEPVGSETEESEELGVDALVAASDESTDQIQAESVQPETAGAEAAVAEPGGTIVPTERLVRLATRLDVAVEPDGGLVVRAPREVAAELASILETFAASLRRSPEIRTGVEHSAGAPGEANA
jgi:superfamily II DNA or RNA helicase